MPLALCTFVTPGSRNLVLDVVIIVVVADTVVVVVFLVCHCFYLVLVFLHFPSVERNTPCVILECSRLILKKGFFSYRIIQQFNLID